MALENLRNARRALGDQPGALELEEELFAIHARRSGPDDAELWLRKEALAHARRELGDLAGARALEEELLESRRRLLHKDAGLVPLMIQLADTRRALGDLAGARDLWEEILALRRTSSAADHLDLLIAMEQLARVRRELGDQTGAERLAEEVRAAHDRLLGPDRRAYLESQVALFHEREQQGDAAGAEQLRLDVLAALKTQSDMAVARSNLGDHAGAALIFSDVRAFRDRLLPPDHSDVLAAMFNLAVAKVNSGDRSGARALLEQVLATRLRLHPTESEQVLSAKETLALTARGLGDLKTARELEEEVLQVRERLLPDDHPALLWVQLNLMYTLRESGDLARARALEEAVFRTRSQTLPPDHPDWLRTAQSLARTRLEHGDLEGVRELLPRVLAGIRARARTLQVEAPRAAREAARTDLARFFDVLSLCDSLPPEPETTAALFACVESIRRISVASSQVALALGENPELTPKQAEIAGLRSELGDLVASGPSGESTAAAWRAEIMALSSARDHLEWDLRSALGQAGLAAPEVDAVTVARALHPGEIAVSYLRYPRRLPLDVDTGRQPVQDALLAFVVQAQGRVSRVELGSAVEIEGLVLAWRTALGRPVEARAIGPGVAGLSGVLDEGDEIANRIRERVLDPVLALVPEASALLLVPDDFLHLVPFDALTLGSGRLGGRYCVRSEVSLGNLGHTARPTTHATGLLALGGLDYDEEPESGDEPPHAHATPTWFSERDRFRERSAPVTAHFQPPPGSSQEVAAIATLFRDALGTEAVVLAGRGATKTALRARLPEARFLHLATHGWFAPDSLRSQLEGEQDEQRQLELQQAERAVQGFAPEALCGLALSGANRGGDGPRPGVLTAEELSAFDLRGCELAVLSACETNVGPRRAGQGIQSLQTALHAAGAPTAITSLWNVDDDATRRLFELFYTKLWKEHLSKADALWQAKMALRAEGHPPRDWAGWVLSGDPR